MSLHWDFISSNKYATYLFDSLGTMSSPKISIIIPAYNAERFIARTLDSVLVQDVTEWECIIVDDGSTDGTRDIANKYAQLDERFKSHSQRNAGVAAARNRGFELCDLSSAFVIFMDNDDLFTPTALRKFIDAIDAHPEVTGAHALADMIDADDRPLGDGGFANFLRHRKKAQGSSLRSCSLEEHTTFSVTLVTVFWPPGTVMLRKAAIMKAGFFDTSLRAASDWEMWIKIARLGPLAFINEILVFYRRHDKNESNSPHYIYRETRYVRRKAFFDPANSVDQRKQAKMAYRAWQLHKISEKSNSLHTALRERSISESIKFGVHIIFHCLFTFEAFRRSAVE